MRQIIYHATDGRILRVAASETAPPEVFGAEPSLVIEADALVPADLVFVQGGKIMPRPALPDPVLAGAILTLAGYPPGARVTVLDDYTRHPLGEVVTTGADFDLALPTGGYVLAFDAPWPFLRKSDFAFTVEGAP